jgi:hypothetical protein
MLQIGKGMLVAEYFFDVTVKYHVLILYRSGNGDPGKNNPAEGLSIQTTKKPSAAASRYENITSVLSSAASPMNGGYFSGNNKGNSSEDNVDTGPTLFDYGFGMDASLPQPKPIKTKPPKQQRVGLGIGGGNTPQPLTNAMPSPTLAGGAASLAFRVRGGNNHGGNASTQNSLDNNAEGGGWISLEQQAEDEEAALLREMKAAKVSILFAENHDYGCFMVHLLIS